MYFKVDNQKVSELSQFLIQKSDELDGIYNDFLDICDKVEENYQSEDSTVYLQKYRNYVNSFKIENEDLRYGGQVLNKTVSLYTEQEDNWAKSIMQDDLYKKGA